MSSGRSTAGDAFTVTVPGKTGRSYQLVRNENPGTAPWASVIRLGPLAADGLVDLTDSAAPADRAFYRVIVSMP